MFNDTVQHQDDIYSLLIQYLVAKGFLSHAEAKRGWNPETEKIYKDFAYYALGVTPPVLVPTDEDTLPANLVTDPVWLEILGMEVVPNDPPSEEPADVQVPTPVEQASTKVEEKDNGDLSFVMQPGLTQPRIPTEVETLATTVIEKTGEVSSQLETGETVTAESLAEEKKVDIDAETDDLKSVEDKPKKDLDSIDDIEM